MGTGLIFAVIAGLWAVVLVPMWLRRHESTNEVRQVSRFQGTMATLGGRAATPPPSSTATVDPAPLRRPNPARAARSLPSSPAATARRRRAVLIAVGVVLVVALGAALAGAVRLEYVLAAAAVVVVILLGMAAWSRRRARQQARRRRSAAQAARRERLDRINATTPPAGTTRRQEQTAVGVPPPAPAVYDAEAERAWEPVAVPLPTYVTAPRAPRVVRVIDLTRPGRWVEGEDSPSAAGAVPLAEPAVTTEFIPGAQDSIVTGEVVVERRRAASG